MNEAQYHDHEHFTVLKKCKSLKPCLWILRYWNTCTEMTHAVSYLHRLDICWRACRLLFRGDEVEVNLELSWELEVPLGVEEKTNEVEKFLHRTEPDGDHIMTEIYENSLSLNSFKAVVSCSPAVPRALLSAHWECGFKCRYKVLSFIWSPPRKKTELGSSIQAAHQLLARDLYPAALLHEHSM